MGLLVDITTKCSGNIFLKIKILHFFLFFFTFPYIIYARQVTIHMSKLENFLTFVAYKLSIITLNADIITKMIKQNLE